MFEPPADRKLYHYTGPDEARSILRDGVIRASPCVLYSDLAMTRIAFTTEPIVWLSSNWMMEMTTMVKRAVADPGDPIGRIVRFALPWLYAGDLSILEYADLRGIPHEHWIWCAKTGELAGSDWTTWRVVPRDVPRADWLGVEVFKGMDEGGFRWEPLP